MVQKVVGSIPISHPRCCAGVVQRLVCKFSKLEIGFRLPSPAPLCLQGHFLFGSRTFGSTTLTRTIVPPGALFVRESDLRFDYPHPHQICSSWSIFFGSRTFGSTTLTRTKESKNNHLWLFLVKCVVSIDNFE